MKHAACLLLVLAATGGVRAEDDPGTRQAKVAIEVFRRGFEVEDPQKRILALAELDDVDHALVVAEVGKVALADPAPEVRDVAAQLLGRKRGFAEEAGPFLAARLVRDEAFPDVQISIVRAIAKLGYTGAHDELVKAGRNFRKDEYLFVTTEVIRAFGTLKDVKALPFLLELAEYEEGEVIRGHKGPAMRFAGSTPREVRRWIWMRKYGKLGVPRGTPQNEDLERWWMPVLVESVRAITGTDFEEAAAFRAWLEEHLRELGLRKGDLPKRPRGE